MKYALWAGRDFRLSRQGGIVVRGSAEHSLVRVHRHSPAKAGSFLPVRIPFSLLATLSFKYIHILQMKYALWAGRDSNPRRPKSTDLQSAAIDHSATYP